MLFHSVLWSVAPFFFFLLIPPNEPYSVAAGEKKAFSAWVSPGLIDTGCLEQHN